MFLLELMCSAVMFVAGINVFSCDDCAEINAANLCVAQRNSVSLPQLNLLQRIDIRCRFVCCAAKFCFAAAAEPAAAKYYSLPICVLRSETEFRCRN